MFPSANSNGYTSRLVRLVYVRHVHNHDTMPIREWSDNS